MPWLNVPEARVEMHGERVPIPFAMANGQHGTVVPCSLFGQAVIEV